MRSFEVPAWHRAIATGLLGLFLVTASPVAPVLTAALGLADRSHHVAVRQNADGIQVVLRHDCADSARHRHGIVAQALMLIAQRPVLSLPDHIIQFTSSAPSQLPSAAGLTAAPDKCAPDPFVTSETFPHSHRLITEPAVPWPPPEGKGLLSHVRSVVLLL